MTTIPNVAIADAIATTTIRIAEERDAIVVLTGMGLTRGSDMAYARLALEDNVALLARLYARAAAERIANN